ncbi:MAG: hypothetical protein DI535_20765 [Citrobacter freundii]|nr:MAG: hypothetical protein DI535_20765 [Citrobacter freundii]
MSFPVRLTFSIVLFMVFVVVGFMYLLRGCLSKYDERSISPKVLYFEKGNNKVVFAVLQYDKATSYERSGGFVNKTVSTTYSIQINDAVTAEKLNEKEIKEHSDIKNHPVEIMGASGDHAWVFMSEPMAFDPFTLKTIAAVHDLEERNPALKGKFPEERRYYRFDNNDHNLYITAKDGSAWMIDGKTFVASQQEFAEQGVDARIRELEKMLKENARQRDSMLENNLRRPSRQLASKEIDMKTFKQLTGIFNQERARVDAQRDSLQKLLTELNESKREKEEFSRRAESLQDKFQFSQARLNGDTTDGKWIGLYSEKEMDELYENFSYRVAYDETARRRWYTSALKPGRNSDMVVDKENTQVSTCLEKYLDGGFLVDNTTGKPLRLPDGSRVVIYKNQIGNEGKIQLGKIDNKGVLKWSIDTGLTEWADYLFNGKQLIITARDNKELSGDECNILLLVNVENGKGEEFDYFEQRKKQVP